jgi:hypothetical protein
MPRLRRRDHPAAEMSVAVVRRLFTLHDELPFELRAAEPDLQARGTSDREPIVDGEEHAAPADVDNPNFHPAAEPKLVAPVHDHARRSSPFLKLPGHYASTVMPPSAEPM